MEEESTGFERIVMPILIIILVVLLIFLIPKLLIRLISPVDVAVTEESLGMENKYEFKEFDNKFLLYVKVEANTELKEINKIESGKTAGVEEPYGYVYQYFNLTFTYKRYDKVEIVPNSFLKNVLIKFEVSKAWIDNVGENVKLMVWNSRHKTWTENSADLIEKKDNSYVYQSNSPYHGLFAIVAS